MKLSQDNSENESNKNKIIPTVICLICVALGIMFVFCGFFYYLPLVNENNRNIEDIIHGQNMVKYNSIYRS